MNAAPPRHGLVSQPASHPLGAVRAAGPGLLSTKLSPPALQPHQVHREAVCQRMIGAANVRLVLVRAPAGFGKTTAMVQARQVLTAAGTDTAWLTLDRADNDVPRFLHGLHQALLRVVIDPPASDAPLDLLDALARHGAAFALFLDDFELITEPAVLSLVREMLDRLPRGGQIVLGSRSQPDLGLGRLRAAGQLLEIDAEQLRFSLDDTRRFFALRHGLPPGTAPAAGSAADAAAPLSLGGNGLPELAAHLPELHRKTEGWIAALWLASMALDAVVARQGSVAEFIVQFSGSNRAVADFLAEDVLARQTPELREFLLRTSILRHLNAPLCQLLTPRLNARRILEQLDGADLFLIPLAGLDEGAPSGERAWRYHSLFAEFLRVQLAREQPDEMARLHLAASGWYESQGRPVPAIDHAIEGGDMPHALHLLAPHAMHFLEEGRMRMLTRWFAAMPTDLLRLQPMMQVVALWASSLTRGPWEAMKQLRQSGCETSDDPAVQAHLHALRPMLLAMMDRTAEAHEQGLQQLARLPSGQPFADTTLVNAMAHVMGSRGEQAAARRLLDSARREAPDAGGFNRMYSESIEGLLDLQQGRLRQASARFRMALGAEPGSSYQPTHGNAWAGVLYAAAVYEGNQLTEADHLLNVYLPLARDVGLPDHMILSHGMRARIAFLQGDIDAALQAITELEYLGHHRQLPRVVASARLERARVLMLQGQSAAAAQELDRADDRSVWDRVSRSSLTAHDLEDIGIGRLRWNAWMGDATAAAREAADLAAQAQAAQRHRRALMLHMLQALAEQRADQPQAAVAQVIRLLPLMAAEGFVRLILDSGPGVGALLRRTRQALRETAIAVDPLQVDHLQRLIGLAGDVADEGGGDASGAGAMTPVLDEPLTRKEVRVLQLLAEGYSNSAMAEKLFVSDSTVRTHLRNINMKLGARSRTQAVALARKLGVIG